MKRIQLLEAEKECLKLLHLSTSNGKERDRIKAVLLRSEGWTVPMIAQALRLHERTITRHINELNILSGIPDLNQPMRKTYIIVQEEGSFC